MSGDFLVLKCTTYRCRKVLSQPGEAAEGSKATTHGQICRRHHTLMRHPCNQKGSQRNCKQIDRCSIVRMLGVISNIWFLRFWSRRIKQTLYLGRFTWNTMCITQCSDGALMSAWIGFAKPIRIDNLHSFTTPGRPELDVERVQRAIFFLHPTTTISPSITHRAFLHKA
jgi:hypothetical protein